MRKCSDNENKNQQGIWLPFDDDYFGYFVFILFHENWLRITEILNQHGEYNIGTNPDTLSHNFPASRMLTA